jgi:hypothetical protein
MSGFSRHRSPESPDQCVLRTGNSNPETPGIRPDTPDTLSGHSGLRPGHSGLDKEFHRRSLFQVVGLLIMVFVDSLEHNYHVYTCGSKFLLIVQCSYTQFQK